MDLQFALFLLPGLVIGLTVHEAAHAITAKWLGDRTAEKMGRVSLNPLRHLSVYGTLALFVLHFGWGKPVIVNLYNFKKPKFYYLLSSLAGPVSNLLICGVCFGVLHLHPPGIIDLFLRMTFLINGMLATINMIPIPPLDGSKIWPCLIPWMKPTISGKWSMVWMGVLVVAFYTGGIGKVLGPAQDVMWRMLPEYKTVEEAKISKDRPEGFPKELVPPENVEIAQYEKIKPNVYLMMLRVFETPDEFETYLSVEQRLREFSWRKLKYQLYEPEVENNGQWTEDAVAEEGLKAQYRVDYWINPAREVICVHSNYTLVLDDKNDYISTIGVQYHERPTEFDDKLSKYKELHREEFGWVEDAEGH